MLCTVIFTIEAQLPTDGVVGYWSFDTGTINGKTVQDILGDNDGELDGNHKVVAGKVGMPLNSMVTMPFEYKATIR